MSKSILEQIYYNQTTFCDDALTSKEYVEECDKYFVIYDKLLNNLTEENKKLLIELNDIFDNIEAFACTEKFIQGFKARFRFAAELLKN